MRKHLMAAAALAVGAAGPALAKKHPGIAERLHLTITADIGPLRSTCARRIKKIRVFGVMAVDQAQTVQQECARARVVDWGGCGAATIGPVICPGTAIRGVGTNNAVEKIAVVIG